MRRSSRGTSIRKTIQEVGRKCPPTAILADIPGRRAGNRTSAFVHPQRGHAAPRTTNVLASIPAQLSEAISNASFQMQGGLKVSCKRKRNPLEQTTIDTALCLDKWIRLFAGAPRGHQ
jgi:hypothetical protein